jgi:putative transposase
VLVSLLYRLLLVLLGVLVRRGGERELEIIVLRHQLAILARGGKRPRYTTSDRALLAAASRLLSPERCASFLVNTLTLQRWLWGALTRFEACEDRRVVRPSC